MTWHHLAVNKVSVWMGATDLGLGVGSAAQQTMGRVTCTGRTHLAQGSPSKIERSRTCSMFVCVEQPVFSFACVLYKSTRSEQGQWLCINLGPSFNARKPRTLNSVRFSVCASLCAVSARVQQHHQADYCDSTCATVNHAFARCHLVDGTVVCDSGIHHGGRFWNFGPSALARNV